MKKMTLPKPKSVEKSVEKYLVEQVEALGGECAKMHPPQRRYTGKLRLPDRLVMLPDTPMFFVECKDTRENMSPEQQRTAERIRNLNIDVYVARSKDDVLDILLHAFTH